MSNRDTERAEHEWLDLSDERVHKRLNNPRIGIKQWQMAD